MTISLTGPMGSGKSSVGRKLSALLGAMCADGRAEERVHHIDLDDYIVKREGRSVSAIFSENGEAAFREIESRCLCEVLDWAEGKTSAVRDVGKADRDGAAPESACCGLLPQQVPDILVLSLGGGAVIRNSGIIHCRTFCVYLKASVDTLVKRLGSNTAKRPLLAAETEAELRARVEKLLNERRELYESCAHLSIVTETLSVYQAAAGIIERIKKL